MEQVTFQSNLTQKKIILFLSGLNLMIIQFVMIRSFSAILFGTEMIILIVTISYFFGYSIGYYLSDKLTFLALEILSVLVLMTHLTLPFSLRYFFGFLLYHELDFLSLVFSIFLCSFLFSFFYSLLLPKFIGEEGYDSLSRFYRLELIGGLVGIFILFLSSQFIHGNLLLMICYLSTLTIILHLLWRSKAFLVNAIVMILLYSIMSSRMEALSVSYFYKNSKGMKEAKHVFSTHSPYQNIEVIEDRFGMRHLYLDGVRHFGGDSLSDFNYYIAGLPASLLNQPTILIVGSGSLGSLIHVLPSAKEVKTVEIDRMVIDAGLEFFGGFKDSRMDELSKKKWSLSIDDAKHFLKNSEEQYDLIVMDIAGPWQMQVALLYTEEFYRIVSEKLKPNGMISVSLNGQFMEESIAAGRIVKTLTAVFKDVFVVAPYNDSNFAIAGNNLAFKKRDIEKMLEKNKFIRTKIYDIGEIKEELYDHTYDMLSQEKMDIVFKRGWNRLLTDYLDIEEN